MWLKPGICTYGIDIQDNCRNAGLTAVPCLNCGLLHNLKIRGRRNCYNIKFFVSRIQICWFRSVYKFTAILFSYVWAQNWQSEREERELHQPMTECSAFRDIFTKIITKCVLLYIQYQIEHELRNLVNVL